MKVVFPDTNNEGVYRDLGNHRTSRGRTDAGIDRCRRARAGVDSAGHVPEVPLLTLGDVSSAVRQGEQSVELADRSGDAFMQMATRAMLGAAPVHAGVVR